MEIINEEKFEEAWQAGVNKANSELLDSGRGIVWCSKETTQEELIKFENGPLDKAGKAIKEYNIESTCEQITFPISKIPSETSVLELVSLLFSEVFAMQKSDSELRKQYITVGSVFLNEIKLCDPSKIVNVSIGDLIRISKKYSVKIV
jgi:hypothetical protein